MSFTLNPDMRVQPPEAGLCECGCGQKTPPARKTNRAHGHVKGAPLRFIRGHHRRGARPPEGPEYVVDPVTGCWIWQWGKTTGGYGHKYIDSPRRSIYAHRWYYEQAKGPIPAALQIDHLCRNRACVNPDHLEVVSAEENVRRGNAALRLSDAAIAEIRASELGSRKLAARFGVSHTYIQQVRRGTHWTVRA